MRWIRDLMQGFTKRWCLVSFWRTIGCYKGLTVRGGTQGVGEPRFGGGGGISAVIVADAFLTKLSLYLSDKIFDARATGSNLPGVSFRQTEHLPL